MKTASIANAVTNKNKKLTTLSVALTLVSAMGVLFLNDLTLLVGILFN